MLTDDYCNTLSNILKFPQGVVTRNHRQIWLSSYPMTFLVPSIAEVLIDKIALWVSIHANYWTAKSEIISSNFM